MPTRLRDIAWDPIHYLRWTVAIFGKALARLWGRDVMLYVGGVSFFAMLAVFPGLAILVGVYSLLSDPSAPAQQAEALSHLMPSGAQGLFRDELARLARAPLQAVPTQSGLAVIIGGYAAHRGFKALLVLIAAMVLLVFLSAAFLFLRFLAVAYHGSPLRGAPWLYSEWTWASLGITLAMSLIYRYAMSSQPVAWRASIAGGAAAALLCMLMSLGSAFYVEQIAHLGATYGSVTAVVVFLIWLSWNVNAVFLGGALATEIELALDAQELALIPDLRGSKPMVSGSKN